MIFGLGRQSKAADDWGFPCLTKLPWLGWMTTRAFVTRATHSLQALPNSRQVGYSAAELLNNLMEYPSKKTQCVLVKPDRISERGSTDTIAVDDPTLQKAVEYIHSNFQTQINVADVARMLDVSRRWLSSLFHEQFGKTPHDYMADIRVKCAKDLLAQVPLLALKDVALRCGFASADRLNKVFRRTTGSSPRSFRESKLAANGDGSHKAQLIAVCCQIGPSSMSIRLTHARNRLINHSTKGQGVHGTGSRIIRGKGEGA